MRHNIPSRKEQGVVLILILAFMTMFAIMLAAFLVMTSNMSDSAVHSLASYEKAESIADRAAADIDVGIKTLVVGTDNPASPIGPFGILENLYGENASSRGNDNLAFRMFRLYGEYDERGLIPQKAVVEIFIRESEKEAAKRNILNGGQIYSFGRILPNTAWTVPVVSFALDQFNQYNDILCDTSALITDKSFRYKSYDVLINGDVADRKDFYVCRLELQMTRALEAFLTSHPSTEENPASNWPAAYPFSVFAEEYPEYPGLVFYPLDIDNVHSQKTHTVLTRLNLPAFSGTGAGDFQPNDILDGQTSPADAQNTFRLPFAFWANAAAPDATPYSDANGIDFRTFRRFLFNRDYRVFGGGAGPDGDIVLMPYYDSDAGQWRVVPDPGDEYAPLRMNPSYTAADGRSLFLGRYLPAIGAVNKTQTTPSFVRPDSFRPFLTLIDNVIRFNSETANESDKINPKVDWLAALRKMIPRPLPMDHWNWTGGNERLPNVNAATKLKLYEAAQKNDADLYYQLINGYSDGVLGWVPNYAIALVNDNLANLNPWDVDNDNDGVKDGVWIPSGLPIRTDENGTPYATMYSFTVLDMDGRVNLNTAGNRDQVPFLKNPDATAVTNLYVLMEELAKGSPATDPFSPWFVFEKLDGGIGWMSDDDKLLNDVTGQRGTGLGPASVNLRSALNAMDLSENGVAGSSERGETANRLLHRRYLPSLIPSLTMSGSLNPPFMDGTESALQNHTRLNLSQPSAYVGPTDLTPIDSDGHRRFFLYTDGIYKGDKNDTVADPNLFAFPWRGKTRVPDYGATNASSRYPLHYKNYPTFDFGDSALRSYDPLGNDILTYMPKYGENPYLVNPYAMTVTDSTFNAEMLENLLRPFDYDRKSFQTVLLETLLGINSKTFYEQLKSNLFLENFKGLRQDVTTVSSDIPAPAQVFPTGPEEETEGVFGIRELIRRCVMMEFYKKNKESIFGEEAGRFTLEGLKKAYAAQKFGNEDALLPTDDEAKRDIRRYIRENVEKILELDFGHKIDRLTDQLYYLLPDDLRAGRRLDLNALSHKAGWLDAVYDKDNSDNDDSTLVLTFNPNLPNGDSGHLSRSAFEAAHGRGLVERMKFARGLYLLLMILSYEDRNAKTVADFYDIDGTLAEADPDYAAKYNDYLEGFDYDFLQSLAEEERDGRSAELIANRIAQYCVNFVDFTDPDATMTPFFYDPNPFDGWWAYNEPEKDWMVRHDVDFVPVFMTPSVNANSVENDAFDYFDRYFNAPDAAFSNAPDPDSANRVFFSDKYYEEGDTNAKVFVSCLMGQAVSTDGVGKEDFGFRLIWGMERPDLLLTETLSFHDLGIADTPNEQANGSGEKVDGDDDDFDQARRPLGSTYLELYCAANPNIPQSPELYKFDADRNLWKLDLSKMTPRIANEKSPYNGREFPVWRVAISASTDPRRNEEKEKEFTDPTNTEVTYKRTIRKMGNSVIERLIGKDESGGTGAEFRSDFRTFSFRTRQFCDLTPGSPKSLDIKLDTAWRGYDYSVSNILGPAFVSTEDGDPDFSREVELDRIVWFGWPTVSNGSRDLIDNFPDSSHIFSRVKETTGDSLETFLFPNQYLVVGPSKSRSIGSVYKNLSDGNYFGVPSGVKLPLSAPGESTNNRYMLAGTYKGLDVNSDAKFEVNKRGLNISEPLWADAADPYPTTIPTKDVTIDGETVTVTDTDGNAIPDTPFDLPEGTGGHGKDHFPIAADRLFGLGTVPGYRSAFVQRVADPNRPYHPSANPYITIDWNMMDLTVFNGEAIDPGYTQTDNPFWKSAESEEVDNKNNILINKNSIFMSSTGKNLKLETDTAGETSVFSSRGWLNPKQKGFFPDDSTTDHRPNLWSRAVDKAALQKDDEAGLEKNVSPPDAESGDLENFVVKIFPKHSLGVLNGEDRVTETSGLFSSAADADALRKLYYGSPAKSGSTTEFQPFEHLVWNDAPLGSPAELLFVPASVPGRFGLEFVRKDKGPGDLYHDGTKKDSRQWGRSLGSGYNEGGTVSNANEKNILGWVFGSARITSPYPNFHHSSRTLGESLNLGKVFDFVTIPSLYVGTKHFDGYAANGDPIFSSAMREPGKMNVNTLREPGWNGALGGDGDDSAVTPFTRLTEFRRISDQNGTLQESFVPFQPPHTALIRAAFPNRGLSDPAADYNTEWLPGHLSLLTPNFAPNAENPEPLLDTVAGDAVKKKNFFTNTEELRKLSSLTTNRSNVFAVWMTVGYFKVERAQPGINMPAFDPDGKPIPTTDPSADPNGKAYLDLSNGSGKYCHYYRAIYPDGYTYGKEMGTEGIDEGGVTRPRAFYLIDRSVPVDFRRGRSWNWDKTILLERKL